MDFSRKFHRFDAWRHFTNLAGGAAFMGALLLPGAIWAQDLAEGNAGQWAGFGEPGDTFSLHDESDSARVKAGSQSIKFVTSSGFDTGVRFPADAGADWDLTAKSHLAFWTYAENPFTFQDPQPVVVLRTAGGAYRYRPPQTLTRSDGWTYYLVPLAGSPMWARTIDAGAPDLAHVNQLEIHQDTWDYGFTIWYDAVEFVNLSVPDTLFTLPSADVTVGPDTPEAGMGRIEQAGETDRYQFHAGAGQRVYFKSHDGPSGLRWWLVSPSGTLLFVNRIDDGCWPQMLTLAEEGDYTLGVDQFEPLPPESALDYSFSLWGVPDDESFVWDYAWSGWGGLMNGHIEAAGQRHFYSFLNVPPNSAIYGSDLTVAFANFYCELRHDWSGELVFADWLDGADPAGFYLTEGGNYTLTVWANTCDAASGDYSFQIHDAPPPTMSAVALGETVTGNLNVFGQMDLYFFEVPEEAPVPFRLYVDDQTTEFHDLRWRLRPLNGDWSEFDESLDDCGEGERHLWQKGTYVFSAYWGESSSAGPYAFKLWPMETDQQFELAVDQVVPLPAPEGTGSGNLETIGARDVYHLTLPSGGYYFLEDLTAPGINGWIEVRQDGHYVFGDTLDGVTPSVRWLAAGDYVINAQPGWCGGSPGEYSFALRAAPAPETFSLGFDELVTDGQIGADSVEGAGRIEAAGGTDVYDFDAPAGTRVYLRDLSSGDTGLSWRLTPRHNPEWVWMQANLDGAGEQAVDFWLNPGEYRLTVQGRAFAATGPYSFKLIATPPPPQDFEVALGDTVLPESQGPGSGNIEDIWAKDVYAFAVEAGTLVVFQDLTTPGVGLYWRLLDPAGGELFADDLDNGWSPGARFLARGGTYHVEVTSRPWHPGAMGAYSFRVSAPSAQRFEVNVGETVDTSNPGAGSGNVDAVGAVDIFRLSPSADGQVFFEDRRPEGGATLRWRLFDPNGRTLFDQHFDATGDGSYALLGGNDYWIVVEAPPWAPNTTGDYAFKLWPAPAPQEFAIDLDQTVGPGQPGVGAGNIDAELAKDVYTFEAEANTEVYLEDATEEFHNLFLRIYDPYGNIVYWWDYLDNCDGGRFTLWSAGTHRIEVASPTVDAANVGDYRFTLWRVPPAESFNLVLGQTVPHDLPPSGGGETPGLIARPGEVDIYSFYGFAGQSVRFQDYGPDWAGIYVVLSDPNGNSLLEEWLDGWTEVGAVTLPENGWYNARVQTQDCNFATGSYSFSLSEAAVFPIAALPIDVPEGMADPGVGFIEQPGEVDAFTFVGSAGETVVFCDRSEEWTGLMWRFLAPNSWEFASGEFTSGGGVRLQLPESGLYRLEVSAPWWDISITGPYRFTLAPLVENEAVISLGDNVSGTIDLSGQRDVYTFDLDTPGTLVFFDDLSESTPLIWRLRDPDGSELFGDQLDGGSPDNRLLVKTGTYRVEVEAIDWQPCATGAYGFQLRSPNTQSFDLDLGASVPDSDPGTGDGNIEAPGDADVYRFTPASDAVIYPQDLTPSASPPLRWRLVNDTGALVFDRDLSGSGEYLLAVEEGRTYWLVVNAYPWSEWYLGAVGPYAFRLWEAPAPAGPTPISLDTEVVGQIETDLARRLYSFELATPTSLYFDELSPLAGTNWRLKNAAGNVLLEHVMDGCDPGQMSLGAGAYTIEVLATAPGYVGNFGFVVWRVPAAATYSISLGAIVPRPAPEPGEGVIAVMGEQDVYTFTLGAPTRVYLEDRTTVDHHFYLQLLTEGGGYVTSDWLDGYDAGGFDLGAGNYRIVVRHRDCYATPGAYGFALLAAPTEEFNLPLGQTVSEGQIGAIAAPGAGRLEGKGERDVYTFTALPGEWLYLEDLGATVLSGCGRPLWVLYDAAGSWVTSDSLDGTDLGRLTLPLGGPDPAIYRIQVQYQGVCDDPVGTYGFKLSSVPTPQTYGIAIGEVVSEDAPAVGAGWLGVPGEQDVYTFDGTAGQQVLIDALGAAVPTRWGLYRPDQTWAQLSGRLDGSDSGVYTLPVDGTYKVAVEAASWDAANVGWYRFALIGAGPVILGQPEDVVGFVGDAPTLAVSARGLLPLTYQWHHEGNLVTGATGSSLTLNNLSDAAAGLYTVVVSTTAGSVSSRPATVTVLHHPYPIPAVAGDGVNIEVFNGIGGGPAPQPGDLRWRAPDGTTLSPVVDFPHPGSIINVGSSFNTFFADTTTPPAQVSGLSARNFILRITFFLKVTEDLDLNLTSPGIDVKLGVGSDDGYQLSLGARLLGQAGDRGFTYSWMDVNLPEAGLWPITLLYAANAVGQSGLELSWQTATSGGAKIIPQSALYQTADWADQLITFEEVPGGTAVTDHYRAKGMLFNLLGGTPQTTEAFPTKFVPVSPTHVFADPRSNPTETGEVELTFVEPGTSVAAATTYLSLFVIDAEATGATVKAYGPEGEVLFDQSYHGGGASQERVTIRGDQIVKVNVTLGSGADTVALDNLSFATPRQINHAPVLDPIADAAVDEGSPLAFNVAAADSDPGQTLSYYLVGTVPSGATLDPATGAFAWTPTEAQGPGDYAFTVRVFDDAYAPKSDTRTFNVQVREVNQPPRISAASKRVNTLDPVTIQATAGDGDLPAQTLTFDLGAGGPAGATIDPATGLFRWTPLAGTADGAYAFDLVVTDNGAPALSDTLTITITVDTSPPAVVAVTPTGAVTDAWPYILVSFSEPLDTGAIRAVDAALAGPSGIVACSGVVLETPTDARFHFPPQYDNGLYELTLQPTVVRDLAGSYLDADGDGQGGEALEDVFTAPITLNIPGFIRYHTAGWRYREVAAGALEGFQTGEEPGGFADGLAAFGVGNCRGDSTVRTSWNLNTDMLLRRTIDLPNGAEGVRVGIAIDNDVQVWWNGVDISGGLRTSDGCAIDDRFVFDVPNHLVFKGANLLAVRGHDRGGQAYLDARVSVEDFNPPPRPDLVVEDLAVPAAGDAGQAIEITWTERNQGEAAAIAPWSAQIYVTPNADGTGGQLAGAVTINADLAAGATETRAATITLPAGQSGSRYVRVVTDSANQIAEFNELNNLTAGDTPIDVRIPDLRVAAISAPPTAQFGATVPVAFTLENAGNAAITRSWSDGVWFSADPATGGDTRLVVRPSGDASPLGAGASVPLTVNVPLPAEGAEGTFYLYVSTDANGDIPESNELNNVSDLTPILLTPPARANLVVEEIVVPANATPGEAFTVTWKTRNAGAADVAGSWSETVALSTDNLIGNDQTFATVNFVGTLAVGAAVDRSAQVTIPLDGPAGLLYAVVTTDRGGNVIESNEADNAGLGVTPVDVPLRLRLVASAAQVAENGGALGFTVSRNGSRENALTVNLSSGDPTELTVPPTVEIPAGQASADFTGAPQNDGVADGDQVVAVNAKAGGFADAAVTVTVRDVNQPVLTLILPASVGEGQTATATVKRDSVLPTPLLVNIISASPSQLTAPAAVTIPRDADQATFLIAAVEDTVIESDTSYALSVSAVGATGDTKSIKVIDNDLPAVVLTFARSEISEGAGAGATTGTLTRTPASDRPLNVALSNSDASEALVPATLTIPANEASVSFPVAAVDDAVVDGPQTVIIEPVILLGGNPFAVGTVATLTVTDDDGPTLTLVITPEVVAEGLENAATGTVTRNTLPTEALEVALGVDVAGEIEAPATVTLAAGESEVSFALKSLDDGSTDGNQTVTVTASAAGFTGGSDTVVVTDTDLPDLAAEFTQVPGAGGSEELKQVTYRVRNQGTAGTGAGGSFAQRLFLSTDPLVGNDKFLGQYVFPENLPAGQFFEVVQSFYLPRNAGQYWLIAVTDADKQVGELLEDNNTAVSAPVQVDTTYRATVEVLLPVDPVEGKKLALAGTEVPLRGQALNRQTGQPVPFAQVNLHIGLRGTLRVFSALCNDQGQYSTSFKPLPTEAGVYAVGAEHPGLATTEPQDGFTLLGMKAEPSPASLQVVEGAEATGTIQVVNLGDVGLHDLTVTANSNLPNVPNANVTVSFDDAATLPALGARTLTCTVRANDASYISGTVLLQVSAAEGATLTIPVSVQVVDLKPRLVATPGALVAAMKPGVQTTIELQLRNDGGEATGPLDVQLPPLPWLSATATRLNSLAPGEATSLMIVLKPRPEHGLTPGSPYTGAIGFGNTQYGMSVPFEFRYVTDGQGDLWVLVEDEYTYYAEGSPRVAGAAVSVRDAYTQAEVAAGVTDGGGLAKFTAVPEGYYQVRVSADKHSTYSEVHFIEPAKVNSVVAFLYRQTVEYNWTVVPTEIEDRTKITIETTFETFVPVPVITIDPPFIDLSEHPLPSQQILLTIKNSGLIAAQGAKLQFSQHPWYKITPLVEDVGMVPALGEVKVPVTIENFAHTSGGGGAGLADGRRSQAKLASVPCTITASLEWFLICGPDRKWHRVLLPVLNVEGDCVSGGGGWWSGWGGGPVGGGGGGGGGGYYSGPVSFGPPVNCDPCDPEVYEPEDILTVDISSFFEPIGVAVEAYITAQTGGLVQPEVDIEASGGARTCCLDDGSVGMEVYGHAGASLEVSVGPGISKEASATISMGDNVEASISGEFQVGLQATGSISLEGEVSSGCNFSGLEVTASGEVALRFFGGVAGEATATYTAGPLEGEAEVAAINGSINGGAHISFEYKDGAMTTEACFEGIYYSAYVKLAGTTYSLFNDAEGNPIEKVYLLPSTCEPDEVGLMSALRAEVIPGVEEAIRAAIAKQLGPEAAKQLHAKSGGAPIKFSGRSRVTLKSASAIVNGNPGGRGGVQLMDGEGVCAKVKLRLEQEAVLTRNAFNATLEIVNGDTAALESVEVLVNITDENYQDMSDVFAIRPPTTPVDGTGQAAAMSTWSASWILIPTREAAPESPKMYLVGGTLKYVQDGRQVIVPLQPVPITVYPDPLLYIKYFHQRDVFADDPFTPAIEPSIPYSLAVLAENRGKGLAKNLRITSAQPQIVENEKGLLIDFKIIASQVEEENLTPSLTVSLGNIEPGATKIGRWLLTSTLQGLFIDYQVTFEHLDAIAGKKTALIDDVSIHEMIHMVSAPAPFDDGRPDFLVNDLPDPPTDYPDRLYLSNGHTNEVLVVTAAVPDGAPSAGDPTVQLTATLPPGFVYLRVPEPSNGQMKLYAVKEGSRDILMDVAQVTGIANAWVTDRTFVGEGNKPVRESILHLFDYHPNAEGPVTYTLIYEELPPLDTSAPSSLVKTLPTASAKSFALSWEGADSDGSPVAAYDLYVSDNGGAFTPWLTGTRFTGAQYTGELGHTYAFYSRAKDAAGNVEPAPAEPDAATTVAYETTGPRLSEIGGQDLLEDAVAHAVAFTVSDPDTPLDTLRFTVESSNLALLPAAGLVLGGTGADRTLAITPAAGRSGPGEVTLRVSDGSESASRTFLVKVAAVNDPPVAGEDQIVRPLDRGVKVAVSELLANDSDPEFDALTLTSVSSASKNGAVVSRVGGWVFYEPSDTSGNADDEFTYVVSDGNGGSAQGRVVVRTSGEGGAVAVELSVSVNPDGTITLEYVGIPGRWYAIQRAASLSNPSWLTLETVQADGSGLIRYTDMAPPVGGAFYRAVDLTPAQP